MYYTTSDLRVVRCVSDCTSVGKFYDSTTNKCVGCHPACETCFGSESSECFECSADFVQVTANTCDSECTPENSYLVDNVCNPCNLACKTCYGPNITDCFTCYPPYSLDDTECVFNETLKAIMDVKYKIPMGIVDYCILVLLGLVGIVALQMICRLLNKLYLKYQSRVDRSYNVFDRPELSSMEKQSLKSWKF
jgi:hypothetical protein